MKIDWIEIGVLAVSPRPADEVDIRAVHRQGIRAIVSLTEEPLVGQSKITPELLAELSIVYLHAPVRDFHAPSISRAYGVVAFIEQMKLGRTPVLLHCFAGIGRTGTMLHFYYMNKGMMLEAAKAHVRTIRPANDFKNLSNHEQAFLEEFELNRG